MKKYLILALLGLVTFAGCARILSPEDNWLCTDQGWVKHGNPSAPMPAEPCVKPTEAPIETPVVTPTEPQVESPVGTSTESTNIKVNSPSPNETVSSPFVIKGEARVFESQFNWRLKGADGSTLVEGTGHANAPDMGQFGPFEIEVKYSLAMESAGTVEIFDYSAKDGAIQDLVSIPVRMSSALIMEEKPITPSVDEITIKAFFANDKLDPTVTCEKVFAAERIVPKAKTMAQVAIAELLKGPTDEEKAKGFSTLINLSVKINRLVIVDGVAQIDFDSTLEFQIGGSCRVGMIRRQIIETLKQFSSVKDVVISVEGRTEDILQP